MSEFNNNLGSVLQQFRIAKGFTQEEVAKRMGLTKNAISNYETGFRGMSAEALRNYCQVLNIKVQEVIDKL